MLLTLRLLTIVSLLSISTFAATQKTIDETVLKYEKHRIEASGRYEVNNIDIFLKQKLPLEGWTGYVLELNLKLDDKKNITAKDTVFTNGQAITGELKNIKNGRSYKDFLSPKVPNSYYNDEHLIAGDKNAKNKIVIFSDPLCPFCLEYIPEVISHVEKNSKNIALYYYHFPLLRLHPAAKTITEAMAVAHHDGIKNVVQKIYNANFEKVFDVEEKDPQVILNAVNKILKTKITIDQISHPNIIEEVQQDAKMGANILVEGTPTIFINGKIDRSRKQYKEVK